MPSADAGERVSQGPVARYGFAVPHQDQAHQGSPRVIGRPIPLEPEAGGRVSAQILMDLAGELPAGAEPADSKGPDRVISIGQAPTRERGLREMPRDLLHRLDRLSGEDLFEELEVVRMHGADDRAEAVANGFTAESALKKRAKRVKTGQNDP